MTALTNCSAKCMGSAAYLHGSPLGRRPASSRTDGKQASCAWTFMDPLVMTLSYGNPQQQLYTMQRCAWVLHVYYSTDMFSARQEDFDSPPHASHICTPQWHTVAFRPAFFGDTSDYKRHAHAHVQQEQCRVSKWCTIGDLLHYCRNVHLMWVLFNSSDTKEFVGGSLL
jgi:hypothetical protein